jgi:ring-1,2-phenylacetyl-CoA epoxidase subunit PaaC
MASTSIRVTETPRVLYALRRADDALILGHRLSEWTGHAPMLEEELALPNIALDLIGQARTLYAHAAACEGAGRGEDEYAYLRDAPQYRNLLLVEQPNGDFAQTIVRQVLYSAFADPYWRAMTGSADPTLAAIAAKAEKESAYHLRHASEWLIRLGDGTAESHRRAAAALEALWPFTGEMFEADAAEQALQAEGAVIDPASLRPAWDATLARVLEEATLARPAGTWMQRGGRSGRHSEHLGHLLAEMQHLQRSYPGATW